MLTLVSKNVDNPLYSIILQQYLWMFVLPWFRHIFENVPQS